MEEKSKGLKKRNLYLILLSLAVVIIAITITVAIASNQTTNQIEAPKSSVSSASKSVSTSTSVPTSKPQTSSPNSSSSEPTKPTVSPIVFVNPVSGGYVLTEYTQASVVYNQTLGVYTGHMGLDIAGEENAEVFSVYDGEITSIETAYLTGTTITVDHGEGLITIYNSIEPIDGLEVGQKVSQGFKLGVISTNNRQEYKDGAHLHFEVKENGKNIDPYKYLDIEGK